MKCPNCNCEIGNLDTCFYCGTKIKNSNRTDREVPTERRNSKRVSSHYASYYEAPPPPVPRATRSEQRRERSLANLETIGFFILILLAGIFILQLALLIITLATL